MDLNLRALHKVAGILLLVIGCSMLLPAAVGVIYGEFSSARTFTEIIIPSVLLGIVLIKRIHTSHKRFRIRDGFIVVSLCWILASVIGALPFVVSGCIPHFVDAFFETCSGFSTTGASILTDVEALPKSMLFWRSFTHWIGGMGILVLAVALLPALGVGGQFLAKAESPGPTLSKTSPKISDTAKMFYTMYLVYTFAEIILLCIGGMNLYDASVHTFATVGTGGFSTYSDGISAFDSAYIDGVITVFMFLSGTSYYFYFLLLNNGPKQLLHDSEFKLYFIIAAGSSVLIAIGLMAGGEYENFGQAFRYASFQAVSILTTTGFATANYVFWPTICQMILFMLCFIGGCSASTAGGLKVIRVSVILKLIKRTTALKLHPNAVVTVKTNDKLLPSDTVSNIASFAFLYMSLFFSGGLLLSLEGFDLMTCFSASASCLGNIGPGFGDVGPVLNYSIFSDAGKILLSFLMIAGRLELFTLLMLFSRKFWNPYR